VILALLLAAFAAERHTVQVGGIERSFWVEVPSHLKKVGKRPAVVVFHGAGRDRSEDKGAKFARHTQMARAARKYGAITVFPNGVGGGWYPPNWGPDGVDDLAFAKAIRKFLVKRHGVDPERIAAVGFSSGGHMAMQWACGDPKIGGLVVVGAGLSELQAGKCGIQSPLPTMLVFGRRDPVNPYNGGSVKGARAKEREDSRVYSAKKSGEFFSRKNQCRKPAKQLTLRAPNGRDIGTREKYRGCKKGKVEVMSLPIGHSWPKGASAYIARFLRKRVWSKHLRR